MKQKLKKSAFLGVMLSFLFLSILGFAINKYKTAASSTFNVSSAEKSLVEKVKVEGKLGIIDFLFRFGSLYK